MICETPMAARSSASEKHESSLRRPRVLVAEDHPDVLAALGLLLKSNGCEAELVSSPAVMLNALTQEIYDALLLDLNYTRDTTSGTEGLELLSKIQAMDSTLAVVAMTAWGTIELAVEAMHRGACEFVQKPWENAHLLRVLREQMKRSRALREKALYEELEQLEAARVQRALLPSQIAAPDGITIVASSRSARIVGGDYYDVIRISEHRCAICIADVMGKGMGAALLMSNLQAAVRMLAAQVSDPRELCERVNAVINVPGKFITFFYCVIDVDQNSITYTNAGHNWPILTHSDGERERLATDDIVLGTLPHWTYHQHEKRLRSGDRLVLFTDGITERADADAAEFNEESLLGLLAGNAQLAPGTLKDMILESAGLADGAGLADDATLIVAAIR
jgi:phosphoserine phosphatase RsbU/P